MRNATAATTAEVAWNPRTDELGPFTTAETMRTFETVGLAVEHDPQGLIGRGLFIARLAG